MNIDEIEKLVKLIENTKDDATKSILRRLLETEVEKEGVINQSLYTPPYFTTTKPIPTKPTCSKCGLVLEGVMSYSCPHNECPTGMGPVMCSTGVETKK